MRRDLHFSSPLVNQSKDGLRGPRDPGSDRRESFPHRDLH